MSSSETNDPFQSIVYVTGVTRKSSPGLLGLVVKTLGGKSKEEGETNTTSASRFLYAVTRKDDPFGVITSSSNIAQTHQEAYDRCARAAYCTAQGLQISLHHKRRDKIKERPELATRPEFWQWEARSALEFIDYHSPDEKATQSQVKLQAIEDNVHDTLAELGASTVHESPRYLCYQAADTESNTKGSLNSLPKLNTEVAVLVAHSDTNGSAVTISPLSTLDGISSQDGGQLCLTAVVATPSNRSQPVFHVEHQSNHILDLTSCLWPGEIEGSSASNAGDGEAKATLY